MEKTPMASQQINPALEARRQRYIEQLYDRSGRSCSTFTGLFQQRLQQPLDQDMAQVLEESER